jgi:hypothetical protein
MPRRTASPPRALPASVTVDGLSVRVRPAARARRVTLRVDGRSGEAVLVSPPEVPAADLERFVARHRDWLAARLAALPARVAFADGAEVPFLGEPHRVRHDPRARRPVAREAGEFRVGGAAEHLARRLADYLASEARRELSARTAECAGRLGARVRHVGVRDTRSRWGSCSAQGSLNFSWRLVLAPEFVVDYVVAHEVAHLREMNHSKRFWALVADLTPHAPEAKAWLKRHGARLHLYG